jgi:transposase
MSKMARRARRKFTPEFKAETVKLVRESGKPVGQVAQELDLTETALRYWVRQAEIDEGKGPEGAMTTAEKEELTRLRREDRTLRMGRDLLKNHLARPAPSVAPETPALVASVDREERPSAFWCS